MDFDQFLRVVRKRRCIRQFKPDPIPDEFIEKILETARWAMSGANGQPWEFVVVREKVLREKLFQIFMDSRKRNRIIEQTRLKELRHPAFATAKEEVGFRDAPVVIVVCGDPRTFQATVLASHFYGGEGGPMATFYKNMANATQLIHLAAGALGLGAQWVSVNNTWESRIKDLLGIPAVLGVHTVVPVGYPAYKASPAYRRRLAEMVHYDTYDKSKLRSDEQIQEFLENLRRRTSTAYKVES
ncbi:MAG: nitroreductase family protein [Chloroflexi bacterium]|nr:nitroreductase family protein [Chloroflexota bacterium]